MLVERLKDLGADPQAKDASRVLRLVQTVNSKNGKICHVVHMTEKAGKPIAYDFDYLCEILLPFTRDQIAQMRLERASAQTKRSTNRNLKVLAGGETGLLRRFSGRQLAWHRLEGLRTLADLRGGYKAGERIEFNGKLYPALYTPKNDTLINQFGITA